MEGGGKMNSGYKCLKSYHSCSRTFFTDPSGTGVQTWTPVTVNSGRLSLSLIKSLSRSSCEPVLFQSLIHSFIHSLIQSFILLLDHSCIQTFIHVFNPSFMYLAIHSFMYSIIHSLHHFHSFITHPWGCSVLRQTHLKYE